VEEVLGALSLLLNGGGVAQLKTIASELNSALGGRESSVRDVLSQLNTFMGQLDTNKSQIVKAIESLNALSKSLDRQKGTITLALDKLPAAVASINRQRDDLVLMLKSLARLSHIGTRVIGASKAATIDSLNALAPTLTKLADAGSALPKALQVFLTYPFVDAVVGRNPTQARNLHMGDYTNLSAQLSLDLRGLGNGPPGQLDCRKHPNNPLCHVLPPPGKVVSLVKKCLKSRDITSKPCKKLLKTANGLKRLQKACKHKSNKKNPVCLVALGLPTGGPLPTKLPKHLPTALPTKVKIPGVGRAPPNMSGPPSAGSTVHPSYDSSLGALLVWGMVPR
jgi:phospholipid/cholesterol/gamma-HCH transport system substrate-binding protein